MKLKMFSVYDSKTNTYLPPLFIHAKGQAIRMLIEAANDKNHAIGKYPADYTLFEVGEFDDQTCHIDMLKTPESLGVASEFINK